MSNKMTVMGGNCNRPLANAICGELGLPPVEDVVDVFQFSNENVFVKIRHNIRGHDVFIVQPFGSPVNTSIFELLTMIDACKRASARRITAVIPYYAYGRSDKKDQPRIAITARLLADCIGVAGVHRVLTMELHAGQIQGFFNVPVDELTAMYLQADYLRKKKIPNLVVVAADEGFAKRARNLAEVLNVPLAVIQKQRKGNTGQTVPIGVIGQVEGKIACIVDDEIDTAGSLLGATQLIRREGAISVMASAVHGVLSGPAIARLKNADLLEVVLTDTLEIEGEKLLPNMTILRTVKTWAGAIRNIHADDSVSELFRMPED